MQSVGSGGMPPTLEDFCIFDSLKLLLVHFQVKIQEKFNKIYKVFNSNDKLSVMFKQH